MLALIRIQKCINYKPVLLPTELRGSLRWRSATDQLASSLMFITSMNNRQKLFFIAT